ncbi:hypothetical protein KP509_38G013700 [Ceratopteris richardii]|uniref:G domain-containing protein n=1 Tax=Ceratopteris richardii TaxID=49495 RepID=A0A8T2Q2J4_CERRI|nr:hypothetical protein KP509_38G013700 [Ceratopteris richardii]
MGNASSQSSPSSSTMTCAQRRGGLLDPRNQLENVYERLIAQNEEVKEQFRKAFQPVRILVVGRSGSGKSTLIRLLVGDQGPRIMSLGDIGNQDIVTEWRYPDPALPLVIHDTNGIGVDGKQRIADIKKFLDARLATGVEFAERVHAVWYVFNAVDNRKCEDGGLLELMCGYGSKELPLLLLMTHNDVAEIWEGMHGETLELLLAKVQDEERRKKLSETVVKVGNRIKFYRDTGDILKQGSIRDVKDMEMVFERTKQLMHKELENVYERLIAQKEQMKEQFRKASQSVHILVVGRSGSGRSTLIRLLLGDKRPRSMSRGDIGNQDIVTEWRYPDPSPQLVIHDSSGIDVDGKQQIADIKKFLDARLATGVEFAERVHAVWYVFNAVDNQKCEDGGLLKLLCDYGSKELPLLLIMTHNDIAEKLEHRIYGEDFWQLLEKVEDEERRKKLSQMMVKIGNKIKFDRDTGEILKQRSILDVKGLEMVLEWTKQLIHKELWITWVACQAADMNGKLEESANLIVRCRKHQSWALSALAPGMSQLLLTFGRVIRDLSKIWNVQQELDEAIINDFLKEDMFTSAFFRHRKKRRIHVDAADGRTDGRWIDPLRDDGGRRKGHGG